MAVKVAVKGGRGVGGFEGKRTGRHLAMLENLSDTVTMATAHGRWLKPTPTLAAARLKHAGSVLDLSGVLVGSGR